MCMGNSFTSFHQESSLHIAPCVNRNPCTYWGHRKWCHRWRIKTSENRGTIAGCRMVPKAGYRMGPNYTLLQKKIYTSWWILKIWVDQIPQQVTGTADQSSATIEFRFVKKIQSGSKVPWKSLLVSHVRKFTKIRFCHRLLWYRLTKHMPSTFAWEHWNHFELCHKLSFVWFRTPTCCPPCTVMGPTWTRFWLLTETPSAHFLLELSVYVYP